MQPSEPRLKPRKNEILKKSDKTQFRKNPRRDEKKSKEPLFLQNHSAFITLADLLLRRSLAAAAGPTPEPRALIARKALLYPPWS